MKALIFYDTVTGNTEKIAKTMYSILKENGIETDCFKADTEIDIDFFAYDLVFAGSSVISWLPTEQLMKRIKEKLKEYSKNGKVIPSAPVLPGKFAVCFCTFAGPHTGEGEARPMTMWLRCFFEHLGYTVLEEMRYAGEFHNREEMNTKGRMGVLIGRPDSHDLEDVKGRVQGILNSLSAFV